jgi:hypothetical protein
MLRLSMSANVVTDTKTLTLLWCCGSRHWLLSRRTDWGPSYGSDPPRNGSQIDVSLRPPAKLLSRPVMSLPMVIASSPSARLAVTGTTGAALAYNMSLGAGWTLPLGH